ncbi:hypothetical protein BOTBODRAFT_50456 [Botryobasidium botryosum FD-172 SS1]|uniref:Uncharacterized protein n=1 Tax=Botryobasidium botryosum (strain FD-172 SS1) TaxID=930990 RepID=A0A067N262_BOTB1|nr:hypothetical protein BOTBODRAFT_50456 [Botryobasidium botryosum FD-172 SS1]
MVIVTRGNRNRSTHIATSPATLQDPSPPLCHCLRNLSTIASSLIPREPIATTASRSPVYCARQKRVEHCEEVDQVGSLLRRVEFPNFQTYHGSHQG